MLPTPRAPAFQTPTVVLTQTETNFTRETRTGNLGEYRAEFLPIGPYTVTVTAPGFEKLVQQGITLTATQQAPR